MPIILNALLVPLAEVRFRQRQVWRVEGGGDGVVQLTCAVVAAQPQVAAGGVVDTLVPSLPPGLHRAGAEGFLHLLVPVSAVAVAVVSPGAFVQQPLQDVLHQAPALCTRRRFVPGHVQAGLCRGHQRLSRGWFGRLAKKSVTNT